ncbi:MAG: hypothetical protein M1274_04025 [Actinobacteria bacterium]|nr:hypothetical protein [Actinomycetota bacterium]
MVLALGLDFMSRSIEGQGEKGSAEFPSIRLGVVLGDDPHSVSADGTTSPLLVLFGLG